MKRKIVIFAALFIIIFSVPAYAHKPIFEGKDLIFSNPAVVPDYQISYAVYGELKTKEDVDFVKFSAKEKDTFYVEMTIPVIKGNEDFKPYIAIIGEGIKEKADLPFKIPQSYGAIVLPPGPQNYFYEKFTQTAYYRAQSIRGEIPKSGDYYVAVYSYDRGGKYALSIGEKEKIGLIDIITFPYIYLKVKYFFNPLKTVLITGIVIIILIVIIKLIKKRR
ncbi:hypothetical protein SAMN05443428_10387 [Caloramator quimbayensis]|uniref:Uncharacterized protein n=1 Tax=Caloramator quimbayensis TaxID=1147123 RepID=A0A1T4WQC9_9CLOT|nr:hypothetical protein [Caloramator quimbayensis]SKA79553.1 hypothetical protein SAMN05443428_10387 [Caloramator quimbayensis]